MIATCDSPVTINNCKPGLNVSRGKDWDGGKDDFDNGRPGFGIITDCLEFNWAKVKWSSDLKEPDQYSIGSSGKYELCQVEGKHMS